MMTPRRLMIFGGLLGLCGWFGACHAQASVCAMLPANPSQITVQDALTTCGDGNYVQGAAGTTSVTSTITIPCGVMLVGPTANPATMVFTTGTAELFEFQQNGNCSSANPSGLSYIRTSGGLALYVDGSNHSNLIFTHNQVSNILTVDNNTEDGAIEFAQGNGNTIHGATIEYNTFGDANSCVATENDDSSGGEDGCGIEIFSESTPVSHMVNLVIKYNTFNHVNESLHFYGSNYAVGNAANTCDNCDIEYNLFEQDHRITIEFQAQTINHPLIISNNVFSNPLNGYFNSFIVSTPCCQFGSTFGSGTISPAYLFQNNLEYSNTGQFEWGVEYWGNGSIASNNLIQGNICVAFQVGYVGATPSSVQYNTMQGPVMAGTSNCTDYGNGPGTYITPEFNSSYHGSTVSPNITGGTPASIVSMAPTISPASGAYTSPPTITLSDPGYTASTTPYPLGNTSVWYTTDGSTPVPGSGSAQIYTAPLAITLPVTIKAVGMWGTPPQPTSYPSGYGFTPSAVQTATYTSTGGITLSGVALVTVGNVSSLNVGSTVQMNAVCSYSNGSTTNCNTTDAYGNAVSSWVSSSAALTISSSGLVTAVSAGAGNITASVAGQTSPGYAITSVAPTISLSSVSLATSGGIAGLVVGEVNQLVATCSYSDGSTDNCTHADAHGNDANFTSSAATIATVTNGGLVSALAAGTTNLQAGVQFGAAQSQWGQSLENTTGFTSPGFINAQYFVFGDQAGGYSPNGGTCSFFLPEGTLTVGSLYDCGLTAAPSPTTQAADMQCWGTYTVTSDSAPGALVTVAMNSCGLANLGAGSAWWVEVVTNQPGASNAGFYDCGSSCSGAAPTSAGVGTYACSYVANSYGTRSGMATAMVSECGPGNVQASQYVTLGQPPLLSNALVLTVTAAPPTLVSVALSATGDPATLTVGSTLQLVAMCTYSNGQVTDCSVADIYGNAVTSWTSSDGAALTIGAVGSAFPGLATAVAAGTADVQALVGPLASSLYALTLTPVAVELTGVSLATTNGVTGLFVGGTNLLVATCLYSDGTTTNCSGADSHGNVAGSYVSSTPAAATVNGSGLVTGVAPGTTTLQCQAGGLSSAAIPLTVLTAPSGTYTIIISGPVSFSGRVQF